MKKLFCKFLLKLFRYKLDFTHVPPEAHKSILVFAPHTSWRDFVIGKLAVTALGFETNVLIKRAAFVFPLGNILRYFGGIPVDRGNFSRFTTQVAEVIKEREKMGLIICPEGTRSLVQKWKRGFYVMAEKAEVPIILGYLDYNTRKCGLGPVFYVTGDYEKDLLEIQKFYYGMKGRRKGLFHLENEKNEHPFFQNR
ncbi:MAG: acyltransferase [Bacteroidetes bacterium HGW-Bacteroidetes-19]|nr:MAG: acyltransferase [Bacteroidetes bacterium HGW-Bacteroidetes-20]PKP28375.1 MAG: acyltransferase [Bacteroidetes bacterium HGW-Bacteroidetes-19]